MGGVGGEIVVGGDSWSDLVEGGGWVGYTTLSRVGGDVMNSAGLGVVVGCGRLQLGVVIG